MHLIAFERRNEMKIAVMGVGSLGTIIGGMIAKSGRDVVLIDADERNVAALNSKGASIQGAVNLTIPVKAIHPTQMEGPYDYVFLLTKQTFNKEAIAQLLPHLHANSVVCTLQNGIPEDSVASYVGKERTVGGTVGFGATWLEPGVSLLTSTLEALQKFGFDIGELDGRMTPRIQEVREILSSVGGCAVLPNLMSVRWSKLLMNATFSGMSAAMGCTFGEVLENPDAMKVLARIADETIKAAHACGFQLAEMQGEDMEYLELHPGETVDDKMEFYHRVWDRHAKLKASMLQDLEKGRKTEIQYINGYVCSKGRGAKVPTPCNDFVVKLVTEAENSKKVPEFKMAIELVRSFIRKQR
jgi:2-dehydropantoate 2-reductase